MCMRKYIVFNLFLFYGIVLSYLVFSKSYAYENSDVVYPEGVTTLNFSDKVSDKYFDRVCSYDNCFDYMGGDVNIFMKDFSNYLDSKSSTEYKEMIYSKGYPITKIYYFKD